jgi:hypothetical protein
VRKLGAATFIIATVVAGCASPARSSFPAPSGALGPPSSSSVTSVANSAEPRSGLLRAHPGDV